MRVSLSLSLSLLCDCPLPSFDIPPVFCLPNLLPPRKKRRHHHSTFSFQVFEVFCIQFVLN